jgi:PAS domain S-box-containing protein
MKDIVKKENPIKYILIGFFLLLSAIIIGGGLFYYRAEKKTVKNTYLANLRAISSLKIYQIVNWRRERLDDLKAIAEGPLFRIVLEEWIKTGKKDDQNKEVLLNRLNVAKANYRYKTLAVLDKGGKIILAVGQDQFQMCDRTYRLFKETLQTGKLIFSDFYQCPHSDKIILDMMAPLTTKGKDARVMGVLVLRIDPHTFLYPLIQSWPVVSETSETLLVRREGDEILFLNELRHKKSAALTLRLPINTRQLPAAMAISGAEGAIDGIDYRGRPVLAITSKIPDSPWYFICKTDTEEIYLSLRDDTYMLLIIVGVSIALLAVGIGFFWWQRQAEFYRTQYKAELERKALTQHYDYVSKYANDIILLVDKDLRIVEANDRAIQAYGFARDELLGTSIEKIRVEKTRIDIAAQMDEIDKTRGMIFETVHTRKDGTTFPVEVSARIMEIEGNKFYQGIIRDITERKQAEDKLKILSAHQQSLLAAIPDIIMEVDTNKIYTWANERGLEFFGEDVIGKEAALYFVGEQDTYNKVDSLFHGSEGVVYVESWQRRKDGQKKLLAWWCRTLKDIHGNVTGALSSARDITDYKMAEKEIVKLNEELERRVVQRTAELKAKTTELERINKVFVDRELRMREIKERIAELERKDYGDSKT